MAAKGTIRIGISGWTYKGWRGKFYPEGLAHKRELSYAAECFASIEINGTFYGLQRPESFARWREETPEHFVFSIKGSRYITHMLRLKDAETPLANFLASGLLRLGPKLGPILWQFPARMKFDPDRFSRFVELLPRTTKAAAKLARKHDSRLEGRACTEAEIDIPLRHAFEIRSETFCTDDFVDLLRAHNAALVVADAVDWPLVMDMTADFVYCRLHGSEELYTSGYEDEALDIWARRVAAWARAEGREPGRLRLFRQRREGPRAVRRAGPDQADKAMNHQRRYSLASSAPPSSDRFAATPVQAGGRPFSHHGRRGAEFVVAAEPTKRAPLSPGGRGDGGEGGAAYRHPSGVKVSL